MHPVVRLFCNYLKKVNCILENLLMYTIWTVFEGDIVGYGTVRYEIMDALLI